MYFTTQQRYSFWVNNDAEVGDVVGVVNATDADIGQFGLIRYDIIGSDDSYFSIEPTTVCDLELHAAFRLIYITAARCVAWRYRFIHRRTGQFFSTGLSHLCPKNILTAPTAMLTCKITLPDSPHPLIISKNIGFRALFFATG